MFIDNTRFARRLGRAGTRLPRCFAGMSIAPRKIIGRKGAWEANTRGSAARLQLFRVSRRASRFEEESSAAGSHRCIAGDGRLALRSKEGKTAASDEYGRWCGGRSEDEAVGRISRLGLVCRIH